jgi:hypothetical protein
MEGTDKPKRSFGSINKVLQALNPSSAKDMLIWDDLWFWGFITQRGSEEREFGWNQAKYWSIFTASKDEKDIRDIENLATDFLKLTEPICVFD